MKRTIEHIFDLQADEVIQAIRFWLTFREMRMPDDDKACEVILNDDCTVTVKFTEEVQETGGAAGELVFNEARRMGIVVQTGGL